MAKEINDLYDYGLSIVQDTDMFKFSLDSILLAEFVQLRLSDKVIFDFCTGNAAIPLILSTKTSRKIVGIELQDEIYQQALESVRYNHLEDQIKILHDDIKNFGLNHEDEADVIICNPPYFKVTSQLSILNKNKIKACARHEIKLTLDELLSTVSRCLKENGQIFMVHDASRIAEIFSYMKAYRLSPKKICFVYSKKDGEASMVLIQAFKGGKAGLKVLYPLFVNRHQSYKNIFE